MNPISTNSLQTTTMAEINDLKGVADQLNRESDALQEILKNLNEKLGALNIGLEVWLDDPGKTLEAMGDHWSLGYAKTGEGWCVAIRRVRLEEHPDNGYNPGGYWTVEPQPDEVPLPLVKASRALRIEASGHIEYLIECIRAEINQSLENINTARKLVEKL